MKREEALRYIKSAAGHLIVTDRKVVGMALLEAWDALRQPGWVRTADRLPEGDEHDEVLTLYTKRGHRSVDITEIGWLKLHPELYGYWMPILELPEVEGTKSNGGE